MWFLKRGLRAFFLLDGVSLRRNVLPFTMRVENLFLVAGGLRNYSIIHKKMDIKSAIQYVVDGFDLSEPQMISVMNKILDGQVTDSQIGSFLTALSIKGESVHEIVGAAKVVRSKVPSFELAANIDGGPVFMDILSAGAAGTGSFTVAISTAFVVSASGVPIITNGYREALLQDTAVDVLEALGLDISLSIDFIEKCMKGVGVAFFPSFLSCAVIRQLIKPCREIAIRTIFDILELLVNPAGATTFFLGVVDKRLTGILAEVLMRLGERRCLVAWGEGNVGGMTLSGTSRVADGFDGKLRCYTIAPEDVGLERSTMKLVRGTGTIEAAEQVRRVLRGGRGAELDMVLLNSGAVLLAAGKVESLKEGVITARKIVESSAACNKLTELAAFCKVQK